MTSAAMSAWAARAEAKWPELAPLPGLFIYKFKALANGTDDTISALLGLGIAFAWWSRRRAGLTVAFEWAEIVPLPAAWHRAWQPTPTRWNVYLPAINAGGQRN